MALEAAFTGEVDRTKPHAELDGTDVDCRLSRYRELMVHPMSYLKHPHCDEGSYFTCNNAQTGLATAAAPTTFSATNPFLILYNGSDPSDDFALRYYLDALLLLVTAAGTAGTSIQFAITVDQGNRYTSGGTDISANTKACGPTSIASLAKVYAGNLTASAASGAAKTLVGNRCFKSATAPAPTANDTYVIRSGAPSLPDTGYTAGTQAISTCNVPPIVIGPNQSLLVHLWLPAQSAASSYAPELSWIER